MAGMFNPAAPSVPNGVNSAAIPTSMVYADPSAAGASAAVTDQGRKKNTTGSAGFNPAAGPAGGLQPAPAQPDRPPPPDAGGTVVRPYFNGPGDLAWRQNLATFAGGDFMPNTDLSATGGAPYFSFNPTAPASSPDSLAQRGYQTLGGGNAPIFGLPQTWLQQAQQIAASKPQPFDPNNWQSFLNFGGQ